MRPSPPGVPSFLLLLIRARWPPGARPGRGWPRGDHPPSPRTAKATLDPLETLATPSFPPRSLYRSRCELARELAAATLDPAATVPRLPRRRARTAPRRRLRRLRHRDRAERLYSDRNELVFNLRIAGVRRRFRLPRALPELTATPYGSAVSSRFSSPSPLARPRSVAAVAIAARSPLRNGARHRRPRRCRAHPSSPPCSRPRQDPVEPPQ